jgi:hypothetical protein
LGLYLEKITAKGIGKLDDLRNKILSKFGFKKIWLEKQGKFVELWGEFNAKVLLMREDGTPDVDAKGTPIFRELNADDYSKLGKGKQVGKKTSDGLIVSDDFARRVQKSEKELDELNDALKKGKSEKELRELTKSKGKEFDRDTFLQNHPNSAKTADAIQKRGTLNSNLKNKPSGADWEAHHVIPVEILEATDDAGDIMRQAIDDGFDFNCMHSEVNGSWQQRYSSETRLNKKGEIIASPSGTHASHPAYTEKVKQKLIDLVDKGGFSPKEAAEAVAKEMRNKIGENSTTVINELFKPK